MGKARAMLVTTMAALANHRFTVTNLVCRRSASIAAFGGLRMNQASRNWAGDDRIDGIVTAILAKKGLSPVGANDNLRDAGLSSLDLVNLMLAVEDAYDVTLPQDRMIPDNFRSIDAIKALLASLA